MKSNPKKLTSLNNKIAVSIISVFCLGSQASASTLYGVSASGEALYSIAGATPSTSNYTTGAFLQQTSYTHAANYGGNSVGTSGSVSAFVSTQTASYGQLHEAIQASSTSSSASASATASGYLAWLDTITFTGAPVGTPIVVQFTNDYDGSFAVSGNVGSGTSVDETAMLSNSTSVITFSNVYTTNQSSLNISQVKTLNTTVGSTLTLADSLIEFITGTGQFSGAANFANTEQVYLDVLTPGVTAVSASGYNYATPKSAAVSPEPSFLLLVAGALVALGVIGKKRFASN